MCSWTAAILALRAEYYAHRLAPCVLPPFLRTQRMFITRSCDCTSMKPSPSYQPYNRDVSFNPAPGPGVPQLQCKGAAKPAAAVHRPYKQMWSEDRAPFFQQAAGAVVYAGCCSSPLWFLGLEGYISWSGTQDITSPVSEAGLDAHRFISRADLDDRPENAAPTPSSATLAE